MPPHGEGGTREREGRRAGQREECPGRAGKVPGSGRVGVSRGAVAEGAAVPGEPRPLPALPRRLRLDQGRASSSVPVPAGQPGLGLCLLRIPPRAQVSRGEGRGGEGVPARLLLPLPGLREGPLFLGPAALAEEQLRRYRCCAGLELLLHSRAIRAARGDRKLGITT